MLLLAVSGWAVAVVACYYGYVLRKVSRDIYARQARTIIYWRQQRRGGGQ